MSFFFWLPLLDLNQRPVRNPGRPARCRSHCFRFLPNIFVFLSRKKVVAAASQRERACKRTGEPSVPFCEEEEWTLLHSDEAALGLVPVKAATRLLTHIFFNLSYTRGNQKEKRCPRGHLFSFWLSCTKQMPQC